MYVPQRFQPSDPRLIESFIRENPFALVVASGTRAPAATHVPVVPVPHRTPGEPGGLEVCFHLARANPHCTLLAGGPCLIVFHGPHAYISPRHYDTTASVPTWNYVAVHVSGSAHTVAVDEEYGELMELTIAAIDPSYLSQFRSLPAEYRSRMQHSTVMFRMKAETVEASEKLSQNRTEEERRRIAEALRRAPDSSTRNIGERMARSLE